MKICNPTELTKFLSENGLLAKKGFSQNFLIDGNIIRKIIKEADLKGDDLVLEIGPGPGALTEALLETGCQVVAIEKDEKLASLLTRLSYPENLTVIATDFLEFELEEFLKKKLAPGKKAKVVANLPYHITTPILTKLAPIHELISDLIVMVQKEVAIRFVAEVGSKDYSSFTLFLKFFSSPRYCFTVEPTCFLPKPSVKSAVVHLSLQPPPPLKNRERFFEMVRTAFQQRRKMMRASLKGLVSSELVENTLRSLSLNPKARPEELSLSDFLQFFKSIESATSIEECN